MAVKKYKPLTPARRTMTSQDFSMLTTKRPRKSLTIGFKENAGRNSQGKISVRHQGGGAKKRYRIIPFRILEEGQVEVVSLEYDPLRSARIALIKLPSGKQQYIVAPDKIQVGQILTNSTVGPIEVGNRYPLKSIPVGTIIHNIEPTSNSKGTICRAAGSVATLLAIEGKYAMVKLPSGEIRQFFSNAKATIGQVSNIHHNQVVIGKAGRKRLMGIRPTVRGKAMYPKAHPHGGGEGNTPIGLKTPKTKWGAKALGVKTRKSHSVSDKFIIKRRKKKRKN